MAPTSAFSAPSSKALREPLVADYPLTKVGVVGFQTDYTRITQPGAILAVRLFGIYADVANTQNVIVNTNVTNGQVSRATGFTAAFGGSTAHSRTLAPNEKVYVTQITVKRDAVLMELLTVDVTTLADGQGTRYRAEVNVKLPGLDSMTPEDVKKTIDTLIADPATASAVESKTIELGMSPDEAKKSLGNPDKIVDLGAKQIYVYKDMKVVFLNRGPTITHRNPGNLSDIDFSDIELVAEHHAARWWGWGEAISITARPRLPGVPVGSLRGVRQRNIRGHAENSVRIDGTPEQPIEDVLLEKIDITLNRWTRFPGGKFDNRPTLPLVEGLEPHDTPVFSIRNATRVTLRDCSARWGTNRQPYFGPALETENVKDPVLERFHGEAADPQRSEAIIQALE